MSSYESIAIDAHPRDVVAALREEIRKRGLYEYAVVDHGHDMRDAGAAGFEAWTLIFGNPSAGAQLLSRDLAAAVDIPLRLAVVRGHHGGADVVLRDMHSLIGEHHAALAHTFNGVLRGLAASARRRVAAA